MTDFAERQQYLQWLTTARYAGPDELETAAWEVVSNVLYERSEEDAALLPDAKPVVERLAIEPSLSPDSDSRLDAGILLATWDIFEEVAAGQPRYRSRRRLSGVVAKTTSGTFQLDTAVEHSAARKLCVATALNFLLRADERTSVYGLPAPPCITKQQGVDEATGSSAFDVYGMALDHTVPIFVSRTGEVTSSNPGSHQGVYVLALGNFLMSAIRSIPELLERSWEQGSFSDGRRWLMNHTVRALALETTPGGTVPDVDALFLRRVTGTLVSTVKRFEQPADVIK